MKNILNLTRLHCDWCKRKARGTHIPTHGRASTSRMRTVMRLKNPLLLSRVQSSLSSASFSQHMWNLLAGKRTAVLPRHAQGRRIMGLVYVCPFNLSFENSELNCSNAWRIWNPDFTKQIFRDIEVRVIVRSCVKFSGLISKLKILEKSY